MLKEERQQKILSLLGISGKVVASDLCDLLQTSEDTVRRDLRDLDEAGLLKRVHGGALPRVSSPLAYHRRQEQAGTAKDSIGRAAAGLLHNGQVILLDGGTTVLQVALHLAPNLRATVMTHSAPALVALSQHPGVEVVMLGGRLFKEAQVAVGAQTVAALRAVNADVCVLGASSLHPEAGITALDYEEADVKRAMIEACSELIVVAAADKLGKVAPYHLASVERATYLVTERSVPDAILAAYRNRGVTVVTA